MYTEEQLVEFMDTYSKRTDAVRDVLRMAPLNQHGIHTISHAGQRFMVVEWIQQQVSGGILCGTYGDKVRMCQEAVLASNADLDPDENLVHLFAGMTLEVEDNPFYMVAYDDPAWQYVRDHASLEAEVNKAIVMRTEKGVPFFLAREHDVNATFPFRIIIDY